MELRIDQHIVYAYTGTHAINPQQPTLVFVHGAGMDHSVWILQSRYFAYHGCNILAVDLPGHGRSGGKPLPTIAALADWLAALLASARLESATFIGHSMGSLAVLECAARYPDQVESIALLGSAVPMPVGKPLLDAAQANDHAAIDMIVQWGHSPRAHFGGNRAPGLWLTGGAQRLLEQAGQGVLFNDLNACNEYQEGLQSAAQILCPALLVLGAQDLMTPPKAAQALIATLRQSQIVKLPGCGHMMMIEKPDETLSVLIDFVINGSERPKIPSAGQ